MFPAGARVPEIELLIEGDKALIAKYNEHVRACEKHGFGFFTDRVIDTRTFKQLDERGRNFIDSRLWGAAVADFDDGVLIAYHVADDKEKIMKILNEKRSFKT